MSFKSSSSDSSSNGSSVTRFTLDGIVAEMVVEVDDHQEPLLSPSKALQFNGLDNYEKSKASALRHSFVALDPILKMDDTKMSNIEDPEQKNFGSEQDGTDLSSKEFHENQTPLISDALDEQEVSTSPKSDLSKVVESNILDEDEESQPSAEILQKDLTKIFDDESAIDKVTEKNEGEMPDQDECNSPVEEEPKQDEAESPERVENKSASNEATKTVEKSVEKYENKSTVEELAEASEAQPPENKSASEVPDEAQVSEMDESKSVAELPEEAESSEMDESKSTAELPEEAESSEMDESKSAAEVPEEAQSSEINERKSALKITETNEAQSSESEENKSAEEELVEANEVESSKKESKLTVEEVTGTIEDQLSKKQEKSALDRLTETIVVGCESTEFEMLDAKALSGSRKSLKLPLKKRKLRELENLDEDVKDEDESEHRTLRTRPSEKEKKEVKNINAEKRKDISSKSSPVPVKKAKILKEEYLKKGSKRSLPEKDQTENTVKRLRSATQDNSQTQRRSQTNSSSKKPETKDKKPDSKAKKPETKDKKPDLKAKKPETKDKKSDLKAKKPETKDKKPDLKAKKPETKDKKPEVKSKKAETKDKKPELKSKKTEIKNEKTETKNTKPDIKSKKPELRGNEIKRQSLRKTTLQKSASVSLPISLSKPKVFNLNRGKVTNLGIFTEIREKVEESDTTYLRSLYRILYDKWPPKDLDELKEEILNFEGYSFKKKSQDLQKREQLLQKMSEATVSELCKILDLKVDSKENMISDIIKFLLKPVKIIISTVDPFDPSMQPVIRMERVVLDEYSNKSTKKENSTPVPVKRSKRERYPSTKLEIYVSDISEKLPVSSSKEEQKKPQPEIKTEKSFKGESAKNNAGKSTKNETKTAAKSSVKVNKGSLAAKYAKRRKKGFNLSRKKVTHNLNARQKLMKLAEKIQTTKSPVKEKSIVESIDHTIMLEPEIKLEPVVEEVREIGEFNEIENTEGVTSSKTEPSVHGASRSRDSSSDATLSSDEAKQMTKADSPRKRISHKRAGKPLRLFTKIKENILNANFSALQRLHILLFGASDKADNLKGNILAFGGFPFLEGSEEWKQKGFLLSLLAQNTLREYLNLLCIEYTDDDQKTLIRKLMKFLAAPSDGSPGEVIKTQVISSEPVNCAPVHDPEVPTIKKKKVKKVEEKKSRTRKVLMDEAQVKRLEADLAREQRIMERERRLHEEQTKSLQAKSASVSEKNNKKILSFVIKDGMESDESLEKKAELTAKQTDAELLNALLQTVYKRRALKKAGVMISAPKKETLTRLGELANVKFLVVTANYSDLDVLHHLIYMTEANKAKVRKNILDFAGFNFSEDTQPYKDRMGFLNSLGYDISKRIAFLLGLCPFKTEIEQQDLNELIMYFLMHPCKSKQIPIRHLPQTFFRKDIPKEICQLMQKHLVDLPVAPVSPSTVESSLEKKPEISVKEEEKPSAPLPVRQKAKKSFKSSCLPSVQRKGLSPSISTLPLSAPKPLLKPLKPTQPLILAGQNNKIFLPALGQSPQPTLQKAILKPPAPAITIPSTPNAPQEVLIQQQTPDGQQKTFKLIKLPTTQPMHSNVQSILKNSLPQTPLTIPAPIQPIVQSKPVAFTQPVQVSPVISGSLPPGLIFFKGNPPVTVTQTLPNIMQTVPVVFTPPAMNITPIVSVANTSQERIIEPEVEKPDIPVECEYGEDSIEPLNPLETADSSPPTDEDLFNSIQEVIHCSDFENITLKNVIDRVAAQYSTFDLTHRHTYMKECIKKFLKHHLGGKRFSDNEEVKAAVNSWLYEPAANFFEEGF